MMLFFTLLALVLVAFFGRYVVGLPKNVWLLFLAQPLAMSSASMVVFAGGLLATNIAPNPELATLPLTVMIIGVTIAVIPASILMKKFGRRIATMHGLSSGVVGAFLAMLAAIFSSFMLLMAGALLLGASMAFVAQMRFAAIESLDNIEDSPLAVSVLMVGGIFAAVIGPEVAVYAKSIIESPHGFAGSFLGLMLLILSAIIVVSQLDPIAVVTEQDSGTPRDLLKIVSQPVFIVAVSSGAMAFAVMSYVMTATPLSMNVLDGYSLESTKWVVQSHISAMYLPSLISVFLIRHLGIAKLMLLGTLMYGAVIIAALSGHQLMHYWWTMVLLGIGWNFLYCSGTLLLPTTYQGHERFKAQAVNDFSIFFVQASGSLLAGVILFNLGWEHLIMLVIPATLIVFIVACYYFKLSTNLSR